MQPGVPLLALHGKVKQERRTIIFMNFARKKSSCLFATDIAARSVTVNQTPPVLRRVLHL